jgi:hypothetical protein
MADIQSEYLNQKEAGKLINRHPRTIRNWEKEGKLRRCNMGVLYYIPDLHRALRGDNKQQEGKAV